MTDTKYDILGSLGLCSRSCSCGANHFIGVSTMSALLPLPGMQGSTNFVLCQWKVVWASPPVLLTAVPETSGSCRWQAKWLIFHKGHMKFGCLLHGDGEACYSMAICPCKPEKNIGAGHEVGTWRRTITLSHSEFHSFADNDAWSCLSTARFCSPEKHLEYSEPCARSLLVS